MTTTMAPSGPESPDSWRTWTWSCGSWVYLQRPSTTRWPPAQHEIAPVYTNANTATDHNQLTMSLLKKVADRHGLVCLLHEKPFAGVNGSGKHDNWSLATDTGENLLKPGKTPSQNAQFLLFLAAFIKGVDEYQDILRCCVSYPGNDLRLGGNEAPPRSSPSSWVTSLPPCWIPLSGAQRM